MPRKKKVEGAGRERERERKMLGGSALERIVG